MTRDPHQAPIVLPSDAYIPAMTGNVGFLGFLGGFGFSFFVIPDAPLWMKAFIMLACTTVPMMFAEARQAGTLDRLGRIFRSARMPKIDLVFWRSMGRMLLGAAVTTGLAVAVCALTLATIFPKTVPLIGAAGYAAILLALAGMIFAGFFAYFYIFIRVDHEGHRIYAALGDSVLGRRTLSSIPSLREHARKWLLKAIFIPIMLAAVLAEAADTQEAVTGSGMSPVSWMLTIQAFIFMADITFGAIGYLFPFQAIGTHIRSTQSRLIGWFFCLICYQPFFLLRYVFLVTVESHKSLVEHSFAEGGFLFWIFASLILLVEGVYAWATISFGLRFSNLTNRGIVRHGPYRYLKHPAYVMKNLWWWIVFLIAMALLEWKGFLAGLGLMTLLSTVYYLRAKTEEMHLREDPAYREYEAWIDEHGAIPRAKRFFSRIFTGPPRALDPSAT